VCKIDSLNICPEDPDKQFVRTAASKRSSFHAVSGELSAYLDKSGTYHLNRKVYRKTVRSNKCHHLINGVKCLECSKYRDTLKATYHCWLKQQNQSPSAMSMKDSSPSIKET